METLHINETVSEPNPKELALGFITDGFMTEEQARYILKMSLEDRQALSDSLSSEQDELLHNEDEKLRFDWIVAQLAKTTIDGVVFTEYTKRREGTIGNNKAGKQDNIFSEGRTTIKGTYGPHPDAR